MRNLDDPFAAIEASTCPLSTRYRLDNGHVGSDAVGVAVSKRDDDDQSLGGVGVRADLGDYESLYAQIERDIAYALRTAGRFGQGGSARDDEVWRQLSVGELVDRIMIHLRAGLHPSLHQASVAAGSRVARRILDVGRGARGGDPR